MRQAGRIVAAGLQRMKEAVKPGIKTRLLDEVAVKELKKWDAKASFKGYHGYPASVCISINDEIVHGIPGERILEEGDIVSIDFGAVYRGFHGDAAITVGVGQISAQAQQLLDVTQASLHEGIGAAKSGGYLGDISAAIQGYIEARGFGVVREYSGHGIGRNLHEDPLVPNFGVSGTGMMLHIGMTVAIEPMVTAGDWKTRVNQNKWTIHTADGSLAAHFEHTIAIRDGKTEVLTLP